MEAIPRLCAEELLLNGIAGLEFLAEGTVGRDVEHQCGRIVREDILEIALHRIEAEEHRIIALDSPFDGDGVGLEPVLRKRIGIGCCHLLHRGRLDLIFLIVDAQEHEGKADITLYKVKYFHRLWQRFKVHRKFGDAALGRLYPGAKGDVLRRAQRIPLSVLVQQIAAFVKAEQLSFGILYRKVDGGGRVAEDHLARPQLTGRYVHTCHRLGGLDGLVGFRLPRQYDQSQQNSR